MMRASMEFGFEAIGLAITRAEPMPARQIEINSVTPSQPSPASGSPPRERGGVPSGEGWGGTATPRNVMRP